MSICTKNKQTKIFLKNRNKKFEMEILNTIEKCRICFSSPGDFNIFTDELYLDEQHRNVLIFKALNFFCNEKVSLFNSNRFL